MANIQGIIVKITADIAEFSRDLKRAARDMQTVGDSLQSIGGRMSAAISVPLAGVGIAALKVAGDMEAAKVGFTTLLGSAQAAGTYLNELAAFAKKTPFELPELIKASQRMMALGFESKKVIPSLTAIGDAVAAMGGGSEMVNRVVTALGQMQQKGRVSAEEMNQLAEAGINGFGLLADAAGKSVAEIRKMSEKGLIDATTAVPVILEGLTTKFGGNMARQSETLKGLWSNLKDSVTLTLNDVGQALLPFAKDAIRDLQPLLDKVKELAAAFGALDAPTQKGILGVAGFAAVLPIAVTGLGIFLSNLGVVIAAVGRLGTMLGVGKLAALGYAGAIAAVVIELGRLAFAYSTVQSAQGNAEKSEKAYGDAIQILEIRLQAHGQNISRLKEEYTKGRISKDEYAASLRRVAIEIGNANVKTKEHADEHVKAKTAADLFKAAIDGGTASTKAASEATAADVEWIKTHITFTSAQAAAITRLNELRRQAANAQPIYADVPNIDINPEKTRKEADKARDSVIGIGAAIDEASRRGREQFPKIDVAIKKTGNTASDFGRQVSTVMTDLSRGIAQVALHGGKMGDVFKRIGNEIAESIVRVAIEKGIKLLINSLDGVLSKLGAIGKAIGGLFGSAGGGASSAAGSAASAAGSIGGGASSAAGAVASGAMGIVGAVGSIGTMISSIVGNFQMMGMNKSLDIIVHHTLQTANDLANLRADEWLRETHLMLKLDDIWNEIRNVVSGNKGSIVINLDGRKLAEGIMPYMGRTIQAGIGV